MDDLKYWKHRCHLAEDYIKESPCDPDIYPEQLEAHMEWQKFKEQPQPSHSELYVDAEFLMQVHPELSTEEAEDLKKYAMSHTIHLKECYGDGQIMYPDWKKAKDK